MRIISGIWRSRKLSVPSGLKTRPTADRTRETIFSMLNSRLGSFEDIVILDLFAGVGAFALEALSRGASQAFIVERDQAARKAITDNIKLLGANARLAGADATALPLAPVSADLIFLDPPYQSGDFTPALASASRQGWIAPSAWIVVETALDEEVSVLGFTIAAERKVGKTMVHLLRPEP